MTEPYILCGNISNPDRKRQFSIEMISKIDFKYDRALYPLWGHSNSNRKRQFTIEKVSKMTEPYILCVDISNPN